MKFEKKTLLDFVYIDQFGQVGTYRPEYREVYVEVEE